MKFEIDFDATLFRKEYQLNFDDLWSIKKKWNYAIIVWSALLTLIGVITAYGGNTIGYYFIGIGIALLVVSIRFAFGYLKLKSQYMKGIENEVINYSKPNRPSIIWEFSPNEFKYKDHKMELIYKYEALQGYRIIRDSVFIDVSMERYITFVAHKTQMGTENFDALVAVLPNKLEFTEVL